MNKAFKTKLRPIPEKVVVTTLTKYKCSDCEDNHARCYCLAA